MAAGLYDITHEVLGKGHFAVVKLARHCLTSELVAVKIVDKTKLNHESLQQHSQEVRVLTRLSEHEHPNIVKLYQVINTKTKLYLVMEYCGRDVCDLYDYIQKTNGGNGLKEQEAKHIFRQICSAISYCHSLKIVHRDLKPENLLIVTAPSSSTESSPTEEVPSSTVTVDNSSLNNTKGNSSIINTSMNSTKGSAQSTVSSNNLFKYPIVKLIDFGFANSWQEGMKLKTSCGSLAYSAPEILLGDQYEGDKVDIWGLGCILYILLYGCNPFMQINDNETLIRILDCSFTTPTRSTITETAIRLIRSLLRKDPSSRPQTSTIMSDSWFEGLPSDPIFSGGVLGSNIANVSPGGPSPSPPNTTSSSHTPSLSRSNRSHSLNTPPPNDVIVEPIVAVGTKQAIPPSNKSSVTSKDDIHPSSRSHSKSHAAKVKRHDSFPKDYISLNNSSSSSQSSSSATTPSPSHYSPRPLSARFAGGSLLRSKSPSTVNEVHERVINDMITKKMCSSKERVERALRLARINSGHRGSITFSSLPVVGEGVPLMTDNTCVSGGKRSNGGGDASQTDNFHVTSPPFNSSSLEDERVNDGYITATYNIIKDRIIKEMQGIPSNNLSNSQDILSSVKMSHTKKSHVLPERRKRGPGVSKPPSIGRQFGLDDRSLKKQLLEEEVEKSKQVKSGSGDIIEEESAFTLPLQRKCSIVSEEGSCDLSGRLSDTGSETLHTILLADDLGSEVTGAVKKSSVPSVDIVITDLSEDLDLNEENEAMLDKNTDKSMDTTGDMDDSQNTMKMMSEGAVEVGRQEDEDEILPPTDLAEDVDLTTCTDIREDDEDEEEDEKEAADNFKDKTITAVTSSGRSIDRRNRFRNKACSAPVASPEVYDDLDEDESEQLSLRHKERRRQSTPCKVEGSRTTSASVDNRLSVQRGLQMVSSSPDLSRELESEMMSDTREDVILEPSPDRKEGKASDLSTKISGSSSGDGKALYKSNQRPVTMYADSPSPSTSSAGKKKKGEVIDDIADHVASKRQQQEQQRRNSKQSMTGEGLSMSPEQQKPQQQFSQNNNNNGQSVERTGGGASVRVITQSKSCNDIMVKEETGSDKNNSRRKLSGKKKHNSRKSSGVNNTFEDGHEKDSSVKEKSKEDRTDCCSIS